MPKVTLDCFMVNFKLYFFQIPAGPCGSACFLHVPNGRDCVESMFKLKKSKPKNAAKKAKKDDATNNASTPVVPEDESSNDKTSADAIASPESLRDGFEKQIKQLSPATLELADDELWTQSDQVLLRSLMEVYQGNFCVISKCMKNKSCKQVSRKYNQTKKRKSTGKLPEFFPSRCKSFVIFFCFRYFLDVSRATF